jgi:transketolase
MGLRLVPNLVTLRPADTAETLEAWKIALTRQNGPTALVLTRQKVPPIDRNKAAGAEGTVKGGYVLWESNKTPELIMIATGSEVHLALEAAGQLGARGINVRVVSMPSWELFDAQPGQYREQVLPERIEARMSIEAGRSIGWERYTGPRGINLSVDSFGHSAPEKDVYRCLGLTVENIVEQALKLIAKN